MLHHCTDHVQEPKEEEPEAGAPAAGTATAGEADSAAEQTKKSPPDMTYQALAVLGIALVAMGEEVGAEMCLRQFSHLVRCAASRFSCSTPTERLCLCR
jgi:26S proteasome regulatory subunit N1